MDIKSRSIPQGDAQNAYHISPEPSSRRCLQAFTFDLTLGTCSEHAWTTRLDVRAECRNSPPMLRAIITAGLYHVSGESLMQHSGHCSLAALVQTAIRVNTPIDLVPYICNAIQLSAHIAYHLMWNFRWCMPNGSIVSFCDDGHDLHLT